MTATTRVNRHRNSSIDNKNITDKHAFPLLKFEEEAMNTLKSISKAMDPLQSVNSDFSLQLQDKELTIQFSRGKFILKVNDIKEIITLQSYISGFHHYQFDSETRTWLSIKDGHDLRGLLTRDILRHNAGCPNFI